MQLKNICIIPARGGSKRIPRKNIKNFLGKPVIAYSIEAALKSGLFDVVMVSTDDFEIANISKNWGAKVPFYRSAEKANDFATTAAVIIEVVEKYEQLGLCFDNICCCYPTAPFVNEERLKQGLSLLQDSDIDTVFPIVRFDYPIWRSLKLNNFGNLEFNWNNFKETRSQDLPIAYHDAGQWYWMKKLAFQKNKILISTQTKGLELTALEVHDIDNESDWKIAEIKYEYLQSIK